MQRRSFAALVLAVGTVVPAAASSGQACAPPTVLVSARASLAGPQLTQGQEIPLPIVYASVEHDTAGSVTYAEAGPLSLGLLEDQPIDPEGLVSVLGGFAPLVLPDLPPTGIEVPPLAGSLAERRAIAAHPADSLPDEVAASWGAGRSTAQARSTETSASSVLLEAIPGTAVRGGSAEVRTSVGCDELTVEGSWRVGSLRVGAVELVGLGQSMVLTVGPDGPRSEVRTELVGVRVGGQHLLPSLVRPGLLRDALAPLQQAGQRFEVIDPQVVTTADGLQVRGSAVALQLVNPQNPAQVVQVRLGELTADARVVVGIDPVPSPATTTVAPDAPSIPPSPAARPEPTPSTPIDLPSRTVAATRTVEVASGDPWSPESLAVAGAFVVLGVAWLLVAQANRHRWPTADWALDRTARGLRRFRAAYLEW